MSLQSTAQSVGELMVEEEPSAMIMSPEPSGDHVVVYPEQPSKDVVMEMHDPSDDSEEIGHSPDNFPLEVSEEHPGEIEIVIGELPGVDFLDPEQEKGLEVHEDDGEKAKADDEKKSKISPKWDWQSKGAKGFINWVKERIDDVPKHSGYDTAGIERAISYFEKLDNEISRAMRMDLEGDLDANKIEEVRALIDHGIERLHDRLDKVSKKSKKKKKADQNSDLIVKEAQKIAGVSGIVVTVPLLISGIVRTCINGTVSAGHDLEDMFSKLSKKFNLDDKQVFECMQLFSDMGYPMRRDRGYLPDEDVDPTSSDNFDWASQFQA